MIQRGCNAREQHGGQVGVGLIPILGAVGPGGRLQPCPSAKNLIQPKASVARRVSWVRCPQLTTSWWQHCARHAASAGASERRVDTTSRSRGAGLNAEWTQVDVRAVHRQRCLAAAGNGEREWSVRDVGATADRGAEGDSYTEAEVTDLSTQSRRLTTAVRCYCLQRRREDDPEPGSRTQIAPRGRQVPGPAYPQWHDCAMQRPAEGLSQAGGTWRNARLQPHRWDPPRPAVRTLPVYRYVEQGKVPTIVAAAPEPEDEGAPNTLAEDRPSARAGMSAPRDKKRSRSAARERSRCRDQAKYSMSGWRIAAGSSAETDATYDDIPRGVECLAWSSVDSARCVMSADGQSTVIDEPARARAG